MKRIICISLILFINALAICSAQVKDSVCIHNFTKNNWQAIRPIDSAGYSKYISNSGYFEKLFRKDSLFIRLAENNCLPKTFFLGEYTSRDSIHFIDFIQVTRPYISTCLEGICTRFISRNQLPQLRRMLLCTNMDSMELLEYDLYITLDSGVLTFKVKGTELPPEALNGIMRLKEGQYIITDNVKVSTVDGIRTILGTTYIIKN